MIRVMLKIAKDSKRKQKRKIIWFNPPFFKSVNTNIGNFFIGSITSAHKPEHFKFNLSILWMQLQSEK